MSEDRVLQAKLLRRSEKGDASRGILEVEFGGKRYGIETGPLYDETHDKVRLPDGRLIRPIEPWNEGSPPKPQGGWMLDV